MKDYITDRELLSEYVLMGRTEYDGAIRALQAIDIINDILNRKHESEQLEMIRIVLGKGQKNEQIP